MLRWLSVAYVFASASSVHFFMLLRDRNFRARALPPLAQVVAGGAIAVLFALWGFRAGALVSRELGSVVAGAVILWAIYPYRPRLRLICSLAARLLRYGVWVGAGLTLLYLSQNVDVVIGGRIIRKQSTIGFYTTSWTLAFLLAGIISAAASSLVFPTLSRLQADPRRLHDTLLAAIRHLSLLMLPVSGLMAALAPVLIVPLLGERWAQFRGSFAVLSILAAYAGIRTILGILFEGYKAIGRPWLVSLYHAIKLGIMIPAMIVGAQHGILGLALAYIPVQLVEIPASLLLAQRALQISPPEVWDAVRVALAGTLLMAGAVAGYELLFLRVLRAGDVVTMLLGVLGGIAVYVAVVLALDRRVLGDTWAMLMVGL
jgi:PST family polysaccharide transporter